MADPIRALWAVYVAEESTYGTAETLTDNDAIEAFDITPPRKITEALVKVADPTTIQEIGRIYPGKNWAEFEFSTYIRKGENVSTAPRFGRLIKAAAFSETIDDVNGYTKYQLSTAPSSVTIGVAAQDGYYFSLKGARVSKFTILLTPGELMVVKFTIQGLLNAETSTLPGLTPSFETSSPIKTDVSSSTVGVDYWRHIEINCENTLYERPNPIGSSYIDGYFITKQKITATVEGELDATAIKDVGDVETTWEITKSDVFNIQGTANVESRETNESDGIVYTTLGWVFTSKFIFTIYAET